MFSWLIDYLENDGERRSESVSNPEMEKLYGTYSRYHFDRSFVTKIELSEQIQDYYNLTEEEKNSLIDDREGGKEHLFEYYLDREEFNNYLQRRFN